MVETVVAVAGTAVLGRDGLTDGAQMELQVHLDELEDCLTDTSLGGAVSTGGHVRSRTGGYKCYSERDIRNILLIS